MLHHNNVWSSQSRIIDKDLGLSSAPRPLRNGRQQLSLMKIPWVRGSECEWGRKHYDYKMNNGLSSRLTDTLKEEWILASGKYNAVCTRKDSFRSREREMCEFHRSGTGISSLPPISTRFTFIILSGFSTCCCAKPYQHKYLVYCSPRQKLS